MRALLDKELADALARRGLRERPVGGRGRRVGVRVPHREGLQPEARCAAAEAGPRAAPARAARRRDRRADRARKGTSSSSSRAPGGDRIEVAFVDPDAERPGDGRAAERSTSARCAQRSGRRAVGALRALRAERVGGGRRRLAPQKATPSRRSGADVLGADGRFDVLAKAEYLDRLEAAMPDRGTARRPPRTQRASRRAGERRARRAAGRTAVRPRLGARRASQPAAPYEVFVHSDVVGARSGDGKRRSPTRIAEMYVSWADRARHAGRATHRR